MYIYCFVSKKFLEKFGRELGRVILVYEILFIVS